MTGSPLLEEMKLVCVEWLMMALHRTDTPCPTRTSLVQNNPAHSDVVLCPGTSITPLPHVQIPRLLLDEEQRSSLEGREAGPPGCILGGG